MFSHSITVNDGVKYQRIISILLRLGRWRHSALRNIVIEFFGHIREVLKRPVGMSEAIHGKRGEDGENTVIVKRQGSYLVSDRVWGLLIILITFILGSIGTLVYDRISIEGRTTAANSMLQQDHERLAQFDEFEKQLTQVGALQQQVLTRLTSLEQGGSVIAREAQERTGSLEVRVSKLEATESTQLTVREFESWRSEVSAQLAQNHETLLRMDSAIGSLVQREAEDHPRGR